MYLVAQTVIALVAVLHILFLVLEMFFWTKPKGMKTFGLKSKEFAEDSKVLAANQGLYNGFLTTGLVYALVVNEINIALLFLIFVTIAGIYGSYSTKKIRLFYVQAVPAILTILLIIFG